MSGSVVRGAGGGGPLTGVPVILHAVLPGHMGPADSAATDAAGAFRFRRAAADTLGQLLVTVEYDGVAYVSDPAVFRGATGRIPPIRVFDTSSAAPVGLAQRHVLVRVPEDDGSVAVLELLVLRNDGRRTRVAPADGPSWHTRLIAGAVDALIPNGDGDIGAESVRIVGDTLALLAPLPPGDRQVVVSYVVPAPRRLVLALEHGARELALMLADTTATVTHGPVVAMGVSPFEGARYLRLQARDVAPGDSVVIALTPPRRRAADFWWLVVVASAGVLAAAAMRWWR